MAAATGPGPGRTAAGSAKVSAGHLLLLLSLVGPGIGLGGIYASHVAIAVLFVLAIAADRTVPLVEVRRHGGAAALAIAAVAYSLVWVLVSRTPLLVLQQGLMLLASAATMAAAYLVARYSRRDPSASAFEVFGWLLVAVCLAEAVVGIRLPVSKYAGEAISSPAGGGSVLALDVPTGFFGNENNLALVALLMILFSARLPGWRGAALATAQAVVVVLTESRIALVLLIPTLFAHAWIRRVRVLRYLVLVVLAATVLLSLGSTLDCSSVLSPKVCLVFDVLGAKPELLLLAERDDSIGVRVSLWIQAIEVFTANPLFGVGPGTITSYISAEHFEAGTITNPHNPVLEVLAEYGLIGSGIWLIAYAMLLRTALRRAADTAGRVAIAALVLLPLAAATVSSAYYFTSLWAWLGAAIGAALRRRFQANDSLR